ncbi:hypothetical protein [Streptomyces smyrnaeus]
MARKTSPRILTVMAGVLLASLLGGTPAAEAKSSHHRACKHRTCLTVSVDNRGPGTRIVAIDIRKPRHKRVHGRAWWSYRKPGGRTHKSKNLPVWNHRGIAAAYTFTDKRVPHKTLVCAKLVTRKVCTRV